MSDRAWWKTVVRALALALLILVTALPARAASSDDTADKPDARIEGYPSSVVLTDGGGTGGTMTFLILLVAVTAGVMFMNAKRSHLD